MFQAEKHSTTQRRRLEAYLIGQPAHDLDSDGGRFGDPLTGINAVGEHLLYEGEARARSLQHRHSASRSCTDAGCTCNSKPRPSVSTRAWRLRPLTFFAGVIPARATSLSGLHALRMDHCGTWAGLAAGMLGFQHHQVMVQTFPAPVVAEAGEPAVDCLMRREVHGQHAPRDAAAQYEEHGVDQFAHWPGAMAAGLRRQRRKQRRKHLPFRVGEIAG